MNFNKVILGGRLVRDPELRYTPSQSAVCGFSIAVCRKFKVGDEQREETAFIDCTAWGRTGEVINQHMKKGSPILLEGRIRQENWEDKQSGGKRSKLSVVVDGFQFVGPKGDGEGRQAKDDDLPF